MTAMPPLRDILNDTPANAIDVDFNFNTIEAHIGQELINRDGSVPMTGALTLPGPPTAPAHAATKAYVEGLIPVGTLVQFAGSSAPAGWVICDGASKSTTDPAYVALFAVIQYTYGGSGGSFNLPNLQGRVPAGRQASDVMFDTLGKTAGSKDAVVVNHTHDIAHNHGAVGMTAADTNHYHANDHDHAAFSTNGDGDHAHQFQVGNINNQGAGRPQGSDNNGPITNLATVTGAGHGGHIHTIEIPNYSGNTSWHSQQPGTTNYTHTHTTNAIALGTQASGPASGNVSPTNANLSPYIVLNFIIRIG